MNLLQQVAFSTALIEAGVPEDEADQITDCVTEDRMLESGEAWDDCYNALISRVGCWSSDPDRVFSWALTEADCPDCAGIAPIFSGPF